MGPFEQPVYKYMHMRSQKLRITLGENPNYSRWKIYKMTEMNMCINIHNTLWQMRLLFGKDKGKRKVRPITGHEIPQGK